MENVQYLLLMAGLLFCAYRMMVAKRILPSTLYLAGISVLVSVVLYILGAQQIAVIELSVGAGLITVLLVYAVSVVGEDALDPTSVISKPLAMTLIVAVVALLGWMVYPLAQAGGMAGASPELLSALWQERVLDVYIQIALIFAGVLGVLGLLSEQAQIRHHKITEGKSQA
jgi:uncharacterized MnhB-related membrane protein